MRIVHLTNAYALASGGVRTVVHALGAGYRAAGHELTLVSPGATRRVDHHAWGTWVRLPGPRVPGTGGYRVLADLRAVRRELELREPDRIEVSDRFTLRAVGEWARAHQVPSVLLAHERLDGLVHRLARLPVTTSRTLADRHNRAWAEVFDHVVATTGFAAREFDRISVPTRRVPLGVDLELFAPWRRVRAATPDDVLLVMCSRLSAEKSPAMAIDALRVLRDTGLRARLVVVGDGPQAGALRRRAAGLPVTFTGHLDDRAVVAGLLADADVVLAPGPIETFGLAALEAMACGTPVVAAAGSAVAGLTRGGAGLAAAPVPADFAIAVRLLLHEGPISRTAARRQAERYGWPATVAAMLDLHGASRPVPVA